jgi:hypothetical protein
VFLLTYPYLLANYFFFRFPLIDGFRLRVTAKGHELRQEHACHVPNDR